ncbi:MAG: ribonuclease HI [Ignavibacteria bacterium]|jgi:ribonuclease HI|nr:ribonuclease HI [Ignavibacteria bacterium]
MNSKPIIIYTDGSSLGNPGKGGWAAILSTQGKTLELSGGFRNTTNNRMELLAVINALAALKTECSNVTLYTDSQLIVNAINKGWLKNWESKGWKKADRKPVLNIDLWQQFLPLWRKHNIRFVWIEGHIGIAGNERCDVLCKSAAEIATEVDYGYENIIQHTNII